MDQRKYLYHARINSHLSLTQIGIRTALSPTVLRNLDEGRFELLPSGVYARSYVRTFAAAVGLDPEVALATLEDLLPGAPDPLPALNARRCAAEWSVQFFASIVATVSERAAAYAAPIRARTSSAKHATSAVLHRVDPWIHTSAALERVREFSENGLADRVAARAGLLRDRFRALRIEQRVGNIVPRLHESPGLTRFGAAAIDALLLMIVDECVVFLISLSSGIPVGLLLRDAGSALGAFCAIPIALYFLLFGGIAGSTLGGYICSLLPSLAPIASDHHETHHPLTLPDILRRAVRR